MNRARRGYGSFGDDLTTGVSFLRGGSSFGVTTGLPLSILGGGVSMAGGPSSFFGLVLSIFGGGGSSICLGSIFGGGLSLFGSALSIFGEGLPRSATFGSSLGGGLFALNWRAISGPTTTARTPAMASTPTAMIPPFHQRPRRGCWAGLAAGIALTGAAAGVAAAGRATGGAAGAFGVIATGATTRAGIGVFAGEGATAGFCRAW